MDAKELKELLTVENIIYILKELGSSHIDKSEFGHILFQTICHNGSKHKLYYYIESKYFQCYTNCGHLSIYDVIMRARSCDFYDAKMYIHRLLGIDNTYSTSTYHNHITDDLELLQAYDCNESSGAIEKLTVYDDKIMYLFSDAYYKGWIDDGISVNTMKKFNVKLYAVQSAIVIPHYNEHGELVGIRRRSLDPEDLSRGQKYMPMMIEGEWYTHPLQFNLYGLNTNKETIIKTKKIVIVESEKGVMQLDTMYPDGYMAVALSSSNLSNAQRDMILNLGVEEVIFALDKQYKEPYTEEYEKYQKKILKLVNKFTNFTNASIIWDMKGLLGYKDSPTDKGKEVYEELYRNRIPITN